MFKIKDASFDSFVAFDFETTGLGSEEKITEIGAVKVERSHLISRYSSLVNPRKFISPQITAITGITNEMVQDAPTIEQLLPSFKEYVGALPMVAHNAAFDCRFLCREAEPNGIFFDNAVFDTLYYAKRIFPGLPTYKLTYLTNFLRIPQEDAHRAWCDAEATARLYVYLKWKESH